MKLNLKAASLCSLLIASSVWAGVACAQSQISGPGDDTSAGNTLPGQDPGTASPVVAAIMPSADEAALDKNDWVAVNDSRLDDMRGGFDLGTGLVISFGLERMVTIDGVLVSVTNIQIPDVAHITAAQASALAAVTSTVNIIQNGPGNSIDTSVFTHALGGTVIQNTLNNQDIQTLTTLSTSVNTLNLFRSLNLQSTLQNALINSRGF